MRRLILLVLTFFICTQTMVVSADDINQTETEEQYKVLVVHSRYSTHPINIARNDALLKMVTGYNINYDIDYLDSRFLKDDEYKENLANLYKLKMDHISSYDAIVVFDECAMTFIHENIGNINVPIIFSGVLSEDMANSFDGNDNVTGFYETHDMDTLVRLAYDLADGMTEFYIIADDTTKSTIVIGQTVQAINALDHGDYFMVNINQLSTDDYIEILENIPTDASVIFISAAKDVNGHQYDYYTHKQLFDKYLQAPIYTCQYFGDESLALLDISSNPNDEIALIHETLIQLIDSDFDIANGGIKPADLYKATINYSLLKTFKLNSDAIPRDAIIVNTSMYYEKEKTIIAVVAFVVTLLLLIVVLVAIYYKIYNEKKMAIEATRTKSEFLAKMSHEIRTPANAISGYVQLMRFGNHLTNEENRKLMLIGRASDSLINIVDDIMDYSMIEEGKLKIEPEVTNFHELVGNVETATLMQLKGKNVKFNLEVDNGIPRLLYMDTKRVEQVLNNILSNAIKFTSEGEITFVVQLVEDETYHVRLRWVIMDTGKGMEDTKLEYVFTAFQQEDNSISRRYGGTGLGLYISQELVEQMEGEMVIESKYGVGTKVLMTTVHKKCEELIRSQSIREENYQNILILDKHKRKKILVAEDNELNQMLVEEMLEMLELDVTLVENGLECVAYARDQQYDLVLMDIHMPIMDGIEATDKIRQIDIYKDIPVIGLTADVVKEHMTTYEEHGFNCVISKPVYFEELAKTLNKFL